MPWCSCWCWCCLFFFYLHSIFEKEKSNFWRITEWLLRWKLHSTHSSKASTKKTQKILSFKYTLRHFHEVHQMCEQFTFKTFNKLNAKKKKKLKIFLFHYREYLDLKQYVDQLRNKQKHLRSQRDVSNIQSL